MGLIWLALLLCVTNLSVILCDLGDTYDRYDSTRSDNSQHSDHGNSPYFGSQNNGYQGYHENAKYRHGHKMLDPYMKKDEYTQNYKKERPETYDRNNYERADSHNDSHFGTQNTLTSRAFELIKRFAALKRATYLYDSVFGRAVHSHHHDGYQQSKRHSKGSDRFEEHLKGYDKPREHSKEANDKRRHKGPVHVHDDISTGDDVIDYGNGGNDYDKTGKQTDRQDHDYEDNQKYDRRFEELNGDHFRGESYNHKKNNNGYINDHQVTHYGGHSNEHESNDYSGHIKGSKGKDNAGGEIY
ncbi:unnamed protein product [Mytilus edulis]|uniref:Uncharacterized protein n=1 Tax=Mytilus edulis TaxID=6550 RepID=A0A8S3SRW1_MYTED|nr:unnamed protein product [Mytilus edulis]